MKNNENSQDTISSIMRNALEERIISYYTQAVEDGSYSVNDLITRIARFAVAEPSYVKEEFDERFDDKPLVACNLYWGGEKNELPNESPGVLDLASGKIFWPENKIPDDVYDLRLSLVIDTEEIVSEPVLFNCEYADLLSEDEDDLLAVLNIYFLNNNDLPAQNINGSLVDILPALKDEDSSIKLGLV